MATSNSHTLCCLTAISTSKMHASVASASIRSVMLSGGSRFSCCLTPFHLTGSSTAAAPQQAIKRGVNQFSTKCSASTPSPPMASFVRARQNQQIHNSSSHLLDGALTVLLAFAQHHHLHRQKPAMRLYLTGIHSLNCVPPADATRSFPPF